MTDVEFFGEKFRLSDEGISQWSLLEFAKGFTASTGSAQAQAESMATIMDLLEDVVHADDWARFKGHARTNRRALKIEEHLMPLVQTAMEMIAERPTGLPSDSSDGPSTTPERSVSQPAAPDLLAGRPDMKLALARTA